MDRRKFLKLSFSGIIILPIISLLKASEKQYIKNHDLITIKDGFKGNLLKDGKFQNLYEFDSKSLWDVIKWKLSTNPQQEIKDNENYQLNVKQGDEILKEQKDYIYWLGHASFMIQIDGKKILTDPCLTSPPFIKRLTKLPFDIEKINPDYLLVSHAHYDHLDSDTIQGFDDCKALIPLKMADIINSSNKKISTQEAGWYQQYNINEEFKITLLPAHHWHKRTPFDSDEVLWGSFMIETGDKTIYFAGDTGYSNHFKDINKIFKKVDIAILPIGAYSPRDFMKSSHINPQEAIKAAKQLNAEKIIPMHFGTFDLSDEPMSEPENILKDIGKYENIHFLSIGDKLLI